MRWAQRSAWRDKLVAGREERDPGAPAHGESGVVRRRRQRHVARGEAAGGGDEGLAGVKVHARLAQIVAGKRGGRDSMRSPSRSDVFLDDDRVGASGIGAPVKMRTASPGPTAPLKARPAADSPITVKVAGVIAVSAARTA